MADTALADSRDSSRQGRSRTRSLASRSASPASRVGLVSSAEQPAGRDDPPREENENEMPWYRLRLDLENTGSVARDHLANERTWLAWVRTSLAMSSAGIAVTQLFSLATTSSTSSSSIPLPSNISSLASGDSTTDAAQLELLRVLAQYYTTLNQQAIATSGNKRFAKPLGGTMVVLGMLVMVLGVHRYFLTQRLLTRSLFSAARTHVYVVTFFAAAVGAVVFGCILGSSQG